MLKIGTDCTGIGSPEQALKNLNVEHIVSFACERDKYARKTYLENHSCEIMFEDVTTRNNDEAPVVDIYFAGFPCQAFSTAGNSLGFEDIRGTIFFNCADYIRKKKPKVFVLENVPGLLYHEKKDKKQKFGKTFSTILNVLGSTVNGQMKMNLYSDHLNYSIYWTTLNSQDFDVPQNRERVFIVGFREDVAHSFSFPKSVRTKKRLIDILEPEVDKKYFITEKMMRGFIYRREAAIKKGNGFGFNLTDQNEITKTITAGYYRSGKECLIRSKTVAGYEKAVHGDCINIGRAMKTKVTGRGVVGKNKSLTITTSADMGVLLQGDIRRLTPRECFRLQGFPDSFKFVVSELQLYKQAGNSITVNVIQEVINNIIKNL